MSSVAIIYDNAVVNGVTYDVIKHEVYWAKSNGDPNTGTIYRSGPTGNNTEMLLNTQACENFICYEH